MDQGFKGSMISMWQGLHAACRTNTGESRLQSYRESRSQGCNRYLIADFSFSAALNASETANFSALLSY
jgi:hypothetical protein